jgi:Flp pilus assembly protein TadB
VPLSEHEQRLLDQIEQALYADDPKFASIYQGNDVRSHYRRRVVRAVIGLVIGIGVLLAGVVIPLIPLGVAGFIIMVVAVSFGVASWQRMTGHRMSVVRERAATSDGSGQRGPRRSFMRRLEERWERRQDDRNSDR